MSPTFSSLQIRSFRLFAIGLLISHVGTWMGRVAADWLVLVELTDHSASALGIVTGLQFLPFLVLAPWAGSIADRVDKRRLLTITQTALAATSLLIAVLVLAGAAQLWHIYVLSLAQGVATAVDNPARQTFVAEMVPPHALPNAVALNSALFNAGRLVGPAVAGLVIAALGTGQAFLLNGVSFLVVVAVVAAIRPEELDAAPRTRGPGAMREGLAYVRARPDLRLIMLLVFVFGTFGLNFQLTMALMATTTFDKGPGQFGLLGSVMAVGSLGGALLAARRQRPRLRVLLGSLLAFTVFAGLSAVAPSYPLFAISLVPVGLTALTALTTANAMVQTRVEPRVRGRVMALYMAIFLGGTPLGAPLIGWIGDLWGPRWTIAIGPIAVAATLVAVSIRLARTENVVVSYESQRRPRWQIGTAPVHDVSEPVPQAAR